MFNICIISMIIGHFITLLAFCYILAKDIDYNKFIFIGMSISVISEILLILTLI